MCRWLAYSGGAIPLRRLVFETSHSLVAQSRRSADSAATTNGDGFGIGWYDEYELPGVYKHIQPAWNDLNLRDLCDHIVSPLFMAHVRSATGDSAIQQSNCHPFRRGRWLFMHNGFIRDFARIKRDLTLAVSEELYPEIRGTTDSELMFLLTMTFGLEAGVQAALQKMVGFVEETGFRHGIQFPVQMTLGISDGERIYAVRYSTERSSKTLYHSHSIAALREVAPAELRDSITEYSEDARAVVSEPLTDLPGPWRKIPESTFLTVEGGQIHHAHFEPELP